MTFREAWNAIIGPRLRKPHELPHELREGQRVNETPSQRLTRISKLPR